MLPKGPLGRRIYKKLKVYAGAEHPHAAQQPKPLKLKPESMPDISKAIYATGRRKHAVARVWLQPGSGKVDDQPPHARGLLRPRDVAHGVPPGAGADRDLRAASTSSSTSAAAASRARRTRFATACRACLIKIDPAFRGALKKAGYLTRDARQKERKKYGQRGARARFQFASASRCRARARQCGSRENT